MCQITDDTNVNLVISDVVSEESASVLAGLGLRNAFVAFAKLWDSTGQTQQSWYQIT